MVSILSFCGDIRCATTSPHSKTKPPIFERPVRVHVKPLKHCIFLCKLILLQNGVDVITADRLILVIKTWSRPDPGTELIAQQSFCQPGEFVWLSR